MQTLNKHISFLFSAVLFCVVLTIVYPHYQYCIDTDATSYLTISQRYADGEYLKAINGYWSPWACWLTALLIKCGYLPFHAAIIINSIAAILFLAISHSFFLLFGIEKKFRWILECTLALFLVYAVFKQSFDDLWECFFLLSGLRILLHRSFLQRTDLWIWLGISGGFAYYAKAYSFPFFILNTLCCVFFITSAWKKGNAGQWLKISAIAIVAMIVIAMPWIYLLHEKYGVWMTSTAGTLNLSWYPAGHPFYKEGIQYLLPPVYPDSPSYWEDPWLVNGATPHFWNSGYYFLRQLARIGYDMLLFVKCLNEMSPFMIPVAALSIAILLSSRLKNFFEGRHVVVALSFLLFPLGFLPINYEARYIWYMLLPGILLGAYTLQRLYLATADRRVTWVIVAAFPLSFLAYPLWDMKQMYGEGEKEYIMAKQMKKLGIEGSFTANVSFNGDGSALQSATRLAYFSGNPYYNIPYEIKDFKAVLKDARRYGVRYFFYYTDVPGVVLRDENNLLLSPVAGGAFPNLQVYSLYP